MYRTFVNTYKVSFAQGANTLIYFLKKVPIIKNCISEKLYAQLEIKITLGVISEILKFLFGFIKKGFYIGIMIFIPAIFLKNSVMNIDIKIYALHILFFLNFILGSIINVYIINKNNPKAFNMIKLMRVNPKDFYIGQLIYKNLTDIIFFVPFTTLLMGSFIEGFIILVEMICFRMICEYLSIKIYEKTKIIIGDKVIIVSIIMIVGALLAYLLPFLKYTIDFTKIIFTIPFIVMAVIIAIASFVGIIRYNKFNKLSKELLTAESIKDTETIMAEASFAEVKVKEEKIANTQPNLELHKEKEGYEYLNSIFFSRYDYIINRGVRLRSVIIGLISIAVIGLTIIMPNQKENIFNIIKNSTTSWVIFMYFISLGEKICKSMFLNCDLSMLRYSYFRQGDAILTNFKIRLRKIVGLNLIPALVLCSGIVGMTIASGHTSSIIEMIPTFIAIIFLSVFFSTHYLVMYYVIQPYTKQLQIKSPIFSMINFGVYMISYICLQIETTSSVFSIWVVILTFIYIVLALMVSYSLAPKTFKLR